MQRINFIQAVTLAAGAFEANVFFTIMICDGRITECKQRFTNKKNLLTDL